MRAGYQVQLRQPLGSRLWLKIGLTVSAKRIRSSWVGMQPGRLTGGGGRLTEGSWRPNDAREEKKGPGEAEQTDREEKVTVSRVFFDLTGNYDLKRRP